MKLAFREELTPGESLPAKLAWLEEVGIDGIELSAASLDLPADEVRRIMADSSVAAANVAGSVDLLHPEPHMRTQAIELMRSRLDLAGQLGAKAGVLVVPQFGRQSRLPDLSPLKSAIELERELLVLQLRELVPAAQAAGVPMFLEPLNRYEAHLVNRLEDGVAFADLVGPEVGIMADFFHMNIEEADIATSIRRAGKHVVYVHVADSNRLQPGRGHLDFRPGFAALKEIGYDGYLGIECGIAGEFKPAVIECVALLHELWAAA
jgi:sugar phosphate isomerase/epimerase